jgi:hypothetical protein
MRGCEGGKVFDSFAVVLRRRSKGPMGDKAMREGRMSMDEYGRTVQLWLVAGGRSGAVVPLRSERGSATYDPIHPLLKKRDSPVNILHSNGLVGDTLQLRNRFFAIVKDRNVVRFCPAQAPGLRVEC